MIDEKLIKSTKSELKIHAKALGLPSGSSEIFIDRAINAAKKSLEKRKIVTSTDLNRKISKELSKYNKDLAYVLENYDKII